MIIMSVKTGVHSVEKAYHWVQLTDSLARVAVQKEPVYSGERVVCLAMEQMYGRSQNLHLRSHCCDPIPVPGKEVAYGTELLGTMLDVPNLIVKVPTEREKCNITSRTQQILTLQDSRDIQCDDKALPEMIIMKCCYCYCCCCCCCYCLPLHISIQIPSVISEQWGRGKKKGSFPNALAPSCLFCSQHWE